MKILYLFQSTCRNYFSVYDTQDRANAHGIALLSKKVIHGFTVTPINYFPEKD